MPRRGRARDEVPEREQPEREKDILTMLTRRLFLKGSGIALLTVGVGGGPGFITRAALAAAGTGSTSSRRRKVLVTIFQRGAMDGLAAVPPIDSSALKALRPRISTADALDLQ